MGTVAVYADKLNPNDNVPHLPPSRYVLRILTDSKEPSIVLIPMMTVKQASTAGHKLLNCDQDQVNDISEWLG